MGYPYGNSIIKYMELQQLKYLCVIAECQNLTKAARKLHVSQPSLSRYLHSLEDELGTVLFDRVGRNIVLNSVGYVAVNDALAVLDAVNTLKDDVSSFMREKNLTVNVYSPVPMGDYGDIIRGFSKENPNLYLRMGSMGTTYSDRLEQLRPDITFFASPILHKEPNYLMLGEEDLVVAVSPDSTYANNDEIALASLVREPFVSLLPSTLYDMILHMFLELGAKPNVILADQDYDRVMTYVSEGIGYTIAPSITWFGNWKNRVVAIPLSDVHRKRYIYLKWPEDTVMNYATLKFRDYLVKYFSLTYGATCSVLRS